MQNYYRVGGLTGSSLSIPMGRCKVVYILPSLDPTLALLLVGFIEYDDDDDDDDVLLDFLIVTMSSRLLVV
ncbi:hypothetical protein Hanom_Chr14g01269131 [Helianthus anomalus]